MFDELPQLPYDIQSYGDISYIRLAEGRFIISVWLNHPHPPINQYVFPSPIATGLL